MMTQRRRCQLNVLYLFAGAADNADVRACFSTLIHNFNACADFSILVDLRLTECDALAGDFVEPISPQHRRELLGRIACEFNIILLTPPRRSFARARHAAHAGPPPLRDASWPRGRPDLHEADQRLVDAEHIHNEFAAEALGAAGKAKVVACLLCPEDLGSTRRGTPASLWQWPGIRRLLEFGFCRRATLQSDWAKGDRIGPTGMLTNAACLSSHKLCSTTQVLTVGLCPHLRPQCLG